MKRIITLTIALVLASTTICFGAADKTLVKEYVHDNYPGYKINYTHNPTPKHKSKTKVTVSVEKSVSMGGKYGKTKDGSIIAYNVKVKKGKRVKSYLIWNPKTNYCDDVIAVVDNKHIRD